MDILKMFNINPKNINQVEVSAIIRPDYETRIRLGTCTNRIVGWEIFVHTDNLPERTRVWTIRDASDESRQKVYSIRNEIMNQVIEAKKLKSST